MKYTAKEIDPENLKHSTKEKQRLSDGEEDISDIVADPSELMGGREKPPPTLRFGASLVTPAFIESCIQKGYFKAGVCSAPEGEETHVTKMESVWSSMTSSLLGFCFRLILLCQIF